MKRIAILAVVMFVAMGIVGILVPAYSQEQVVNSISAEVVSVDLEKSTLAIKTVKDAIAQTYEDQIVSVLPETKIFKGDVVLKLSDLMIGDKVIVKYTLDTLGEWKAESIGVETAEVATVGD